VRRAIVTRVEGRRYRFGGTCLQVGDEGGNRRITIAAELLGGQSLVQLGVA
jgi:hypothetical protein